MITYFKSQIMGQNSGSASSAPLPNVSIVTPSFNMAGYLPLTIESVLSQDYPKIEYIVIDGGSTDGTTEILKHYERRLCYISEPDNGASDAINKGFRMSRGSIFAWINADDTYLPGAVSAAVNQLRAHPNWAAVYGAAYWTDAGGKVLGAYPTRQADFPALGRECCICQPAAFLRSDIFASVGMLDKDLHSAFDYDLWIRVASEHELGFIPDYLATSRMHAGNKTLGERSKVFEESFRLLKHYYGYVPFPWVYDYCSYLLHRKDQFFEKPGPSILDYAVSLPIGSWHNRKRLARFCREWVSGLTFKALMRQCSRSVPGRERAL